MATRAKIIFIGSLLLLLLGCHASTPTQISNTVEPIKQSSWLYRCDNSDSIVINHRRDGSWLFSSAGTVQLQSARSGSGARYSNGSDEFWEHQGVAQATVNNQRFINCKLDRRASIWEDAKLRGVDYRALGNEPSWVIELSDKTQLRIVTDYGQTIRLLTMAGPTSNTDKLQSVYRNKEATLTITAQPCRDSMSGEEFSSSAELQLNDKTYSGCGRALH